MQLGDAVHVGAGVGGEVGHAHHRVLVVGEDQHALDLVFAGTLGLELGDELLVDALDDLEVARQQLANERCRPHFQCFRKQRVAGIVEGLVGDFPGGVPVVAVFVDHDAHELRNADHRVGVVELERDLVGEGGQIRLVGVRVEHANRIVNGGAGEEVLLFETQFLAHLGGVLRVEHLGDILGLDLRLHRVEVLGLVEREQVELVVGAGLPQTQRVHATRGVAGHHVVHRDRAHGPARLPHTLAVLLDDLAAEVDALIALVVDVPPRVLIGQPVVRTLDLATLVIEFLAEDAVLVLDAVAEGGNAERGERIDEAGCETAETAVAQARFVFRVDHCLRVEAEAAHGLFELRGEARVEQCVAQLLAHQEFRGQVAHSLRVAVDHVLLGLHPGIHEMTADHGCSGNIDIGRLGLFRGDPLCVLERLSNFVSEFVGGQRGLRCR